MDAHRGGGGGAPPAGQQIVHVRGDSQTELEALFSAVMNPSKSARQPSSLPMRMRKLPDSFFRQPDSRGHSRQASSDGGVCGSLTPHHVRAHSSPASLPVNSLSTQAADVAVTPIIPDDVPLPHGWEMAKTPTGQRYFLNHLDKTTTWHDPRLSQLQSAAAQHPISGAPIHAHSLSNPAPTSQPPNINQDTAQKMNPALLGLALQQRQEKERLRCKQQGLPPQITAQEAGGRNQMPGGMDHDRNAQTLVPSLDLRIRASNHEPTLNGAHSRNESTDSGLSVSSLPRTSDHMLSSVDHMDTGDSGETSMTLQESMPVLPMSDGEELMPCIPEGLSSDLLMDMETVLSGSHMDRDSLLTWL
ncbi:transcriptional coactivator YAP1 isoform X2 [Labrus bergylta]|uniref:transcriptional coactivator YAP1 isoform X2 n=1 Tax=Labrus bergylta TaxID=56723 RepID=UPI0009B39896|nr:transcriptional coactivator YAP1-like isoform X2 [Labrus bergylta]